MLARSAAILLTDRLLVPRQGREDLVRVPEALAPRPDLVVPDLVLRQGLVVPDLVLRQDLDVPLLIQGVRLPGREDPALAPRPDPDVPLRVPEARVLRLDLAALVPIRVVRRISEDSFRFCASAFF